jgi:hypothetical protein
VKVLRLQDLTEKAPDQIEGVSINLTQTEEAVKSWTGLLERAALRLVKMMD